MIYTPHIYQQHATDMIVKNAVVGLFLEMGLGKTISSLTAIESLLYDHFESYKVLIIAPLRVAEDTWSTEIDKWEHTSGLKVSKVLGSPSRRLDALSSKADIWVINRENVVWLVDHYRKKWPFDMVVIDELSSFKSASAERFKALKKVRPFIKKMVGLTGTPAPNGLLDLWAQVYLLDGGERLGKTFSGYRDQYFDPASVGRVNGRLVNFSYKPKAGAEDLIYNKISDICISMKAADWLAVPDRIDITVKVKMTEAEKKAYAVLEKDFILTLTDGEVEASTAAVLAGKLLQLANGAVYDADRAVLPLHDHKLDALESLIEQANGKPVLVFYAFKHDLSRLQERFKGAVKLEDSNDIKKWNAGQIPIMLVHPASAGHGLNLQQGGNILVWFGLTWSLELYQQANARLHRQGQTEKVSVYHIITEGTIDEDVMGSIERKDRSQESLIQAVKARVHDVAKGV